MTSQTRSLLYAPFLLDRCRCSCGSQYLSTSLCYIFVEACASFVLSIPGNVNLFLILLRLE